VDDGGAGAPCSQEEGEGGAREEETGRRRKGWGWPLRPAIRLIANLFNPSQFGSIYLQLQKYLRKVIHLRKGNQLATITETAAEIGDGPGGRHHPWPRRLIGPAWALVWLARNKPFQGADR
jgi:hypothetical protein